MRLRTTIGHFRRTLSQTFLSLRISTTRIARIPASTTRSCAALIDAKALSEIRPGMEDSEAYITVRTTLEAFRDNTDLEYVYTVYEEKSFSAAAKKLFMTQPALSAAVKKVESS